MTEGSSDQGQTVDHPPEHSPAMRALIAAQSSIEVAHAALDAAQQTVLIAMTIEREREEAKNQAQFQSLDAGPTCTHGGAVVETAGGRYLVCPEECPASGPLDG